MPTMILVAVGSLAASVLSLGPVQVDVDATPSGVSGDEIWPNFVG